MGLKPKFTKEDINKLFKERLARIEQAIISRLTFVGENFVKNARNNGAYKDQTGNLRSSIGYIVLRNGKKLREDFEEAEVGTDKKTGLRDGKKLAKEVGKTLNTGYVLICVAGMDYAAALESGNRKGYTVAPRDVLTASAIIAKNDLEKAIKALKSKISKL